MSANGKKKRGEAGVSNANSIPFRYHGGSVDRPAYMTPDTRAAMSTVRGDHRNTSTYATGMFGGLCALRLGYGFEGSDRFLDRVKG